MIINVNKHSITYNVTCTSSIYIKLFINVTICNEILYGYITKRNSILLE